MSELRWILLVAGVLLIAGIYLWGVRARRRSAAPRHERMTRVEPARTVAVVAEPARVEPEVRLDDAPPERRPRLLSDNGPSYVASDLSSWLEGQGMKHTRGKPYHPMTQGKIERWHLSLKSRILLENYYLPGDLEALTRVDELAWDEQRASVLLYR